MRLCFLFGVCYTLRERLQDWRVSTMDEVLSMNPSAEDAAQLKLTLTQCIAEIDRLRELMRQDDMVIARSQARTWALIAEMKAMREPTGRKAALKAAHAPVCLHRELEHAGLSARLPDIAVSVSARRRGHGSDCRGQCQRGRLGGNGGGGVSAGGFDRQRGQQRVCRGQQSGAGAGDGRLSAAAEPGCGGSRRAA